MSAGWGGEEGSEGIHVCHVLECAVPKESKRLECSPAAAMIDWLNWGVEGILH